jgi:hypothetical protein
MNSVRVRLFEVAVCPLRQESIMHFYTALVNPAVDVVQNY